MQHLLERSLNYALQDVRGTDIDELETMLRLQAPSGAPDTAADYQAQPAEHFFTPATDMTLLRPLIGGYAAYKLMRGEKGVTPLVIAMALSDAEGQIARLIDNHFPGSGWGSTETGKSLDPIADSMGFLEVAAGALKGPRVSRLGKLAVSIVLAQEGTKSIWALRANRRHRKETGEKLVLSPSRTGKLATGEKFAALLLATATNDLESGRKRTVAGIAAVGMALAGAYHGEKARKSYKKLLTD